MATWKNLSEADKNKFKASCLEDVSEDAGDELPPRNMKRHRKALRTASSWRQRFSTYDWPIDPACVEAAVTCKSRDTAPLGTCRGHAHGSGMYGRFTEQIRSTYDKEMLVKNRGSIPSEEVVTLPAACPQLHPGLCVTLDREIYSSALQVAKCIEKHFSEAMIHKFFLIRGSSERLENQIVYEEYVFFALKRRKSRRHPISHVFTHVGRCGDSLLVIERAPEQCEWLCQWDLAKEALNVCTTSLLCMQLQLQRQAHGPFTLCPGQDFLGVEIWPSPARPVRVRKDADDLLLETFGEKKPNTKRKEGGVKLSKPVPTYGHCHMALTSSPENESSEDMGAGSVHESSMEFDADAGADTEDSEMPKVDIAPDDKEMPKVEDEVAPASAAAAAPEYSPTSPASEDEVAPALEDEVAPASEDEVAPESEDEVHHAMPGDNVVWRHGKFFISVVSRGGGQIGWGATCGHHHDPLRPHLSCKTSITYAKDGSLTDENMIKGLKRWLLYGLAIPRKGKGKGKGKDPLQDTKGEHMKIKARDCALMPDEPGEDLDGNIAALYWD